MVFALFLKIILAQNLSLKKGSCKLKKADIIAAIVGILLSGYVFMATAQFPQDNVLLLGPSFFPRLLAVGLLIMSILLLIKALMGRSMQSNDKFDIKNPGTQRAGIALLATIVYCLVLPYLGFIIDNVLYLIFLMYLLKQRSYLKMVIISLGVTFMVYAVFRMALNITLPLGLLG